MHKRSAAFSMTPYVLSDMIVYVFYVLVLLSSSAQYEVIEVPTYPYCNGEPRKDLNTMCPQNDGMTDSLRDIFLTMHNQMRSSVARGLEADALGGNAPQAAGMLKMSYDCNIEASAMRHTAKCDYRHSTWEEREGLGENLASGSLPNLNKERLAKEATQAWWDELRKEGVGPSAIFDAARFLKIGHYTQMAWQSTNKLGCSIKHCPTMTFVACQYGPSGNYPGAKIYHVGAPCSKCPSKHSCEPNEGLCYPS